MPKSVKNYLKSYKLFSGDKLSSSVYPNTKAIGNTRCNNHVITQLEQKFLNLSRNIKTNCAVQFHGNATMNCIIHKTYYEIKNNSSPNHLDHQLKQCKQYYILQ